MHIPLAARYTCTHLSVTDNKERAHHLSEPDHFFFGVQPCEAMKPLTDFMWLRCYFLFQSNKLCWVCLGYFLFLIVVTELEQAVERQAL